jgi:surface antigen
MKLDVFLIVGLLAIAGCTTTSLKPSLPSLGGNKGGKTAAVIIAAMNGGLIGGSVGQGLSTADRSTGLEAEYRTLEYTQSGKPVTWRGSKEGTYGEVTAAQPYRVGAQDCRQYTHTVYIGGTPRVAKGTACRNQDGSWTPLT